MSRTPDSRQLRAIGHRLKPIVTIAGNGLSEGVRAELERALSDHELIKIKLAVGDRETRDAVLDELLKAHGAELVQRVGNTALIPASPISSARRASATSGAAP
jgi:RNA-binding protein